MEMTREQYLDFMYNRENIRRCDGCPENHGFDAWQDRLPCGQYTCWVYCHCKDEIEAERLEKARAELERKDEIVAIQKGIYPDAEITVEKA